MRKSSKELILLWLALILVPVSLMAKEPPANLQPLEEVPPPTISNEADADEPQVTIVKKQGETIEEYRVGGELYMMKVIPDHGVPYYLHKEDQNGAWVNSGPTPPISIPKWIIFRF